mmetsp:Transcript_203/g.500  ORF Transcript_203/g.500 Transcript_203/m.500 type:complete len:197 (-) Transcript_203:538-1128(-)
MGDHPPRNDTGRSRAATVDPLCGGSFHPLRLDKESLVELMLEMADGAEGRTGGGTHFTFELSDYSDDEDARSKGGDGRGGGREPHGADLEAGGGGGGGGGGSRRAIGSGVRGSSARSSACGSGVPASRFFSKRAIEPTRPAPAPEARLSTPPSTAPRCASPRCGGGRRRSRSSTAARRTCGWTWPAPTQPSRCARS